MCLRFELCAFVRAGGKIVKCLELLTRTAVTIIASAWSGARQVCRWCHVVSRFSPSFVLLQLQLCLMTSYSQDLAFKEAVGNAKPQNKREPSRPRPTEHQAIRSANGSTSVKHASMNGIREFLRPSDSKLQHQA